MLSNIAVEEVEEIYIYNFLIYYHLVVFVSVLYVLYGDPNKILIHSTGLETFHTINMNLMVVQGDKSRDDQSR